MNSKTKILLVSPYFFPTNRYQQELCSRLATDYSQIEITVLCYKTTKHEVKTFNNLDIYYVPCWTILKDQFVLPNFISLVKMLIFIKKEKHINLLMCETRFFDSSWWIPIIAKIWKIPAFIVDHCASVPKHNWLPVRFALRIFDKFFAPVILNSYSAVACSNKAVFEYLKHLGVKKLQIIGTGVDSELFNPNKLSSNLSDIGIKIGEDELLITFASRLIYTKGAELFYDAVTPLLNKYPNLKVAIGGEGPLYDQINKKITSQKTGDKVFLLGLLSTDKLARLLSRTDIFVHPSSHHDGIPNAVLEAGASSCLVIASQSGGTAEVIRNNQTGILLDDLLPETIRSAIEDGITDNNKRLILGKALRLMLIRDYSWGKVVDLTRSLVISLTSQP